MKTITAINPQAKNAKRCNIFLDGQFFCGLDLETVMKNRLKAGMEIEESALETLQLESEKSAALDRAMTYISGSFKTERKLADYLKEKGYTPAVCGYVLEKCKEYGFIDDGYYAERYAQSYSDKKGKRLIAMELKAKGVGEENIERALCSVCGGEEAALAVARKYLKGKTADRELKQKVYRYLLSKGFSYDEAKFAVENLEREDD